MCPQAEEMRVRGALSTNHLKCPTWTWSRQWIVWELSRGLNPNTLENSLQAAATIFRLRPPSSGTTASSRCCPFPPRPTPTLATTFPGVINSTTGGTSPPRSSGRPRMEGKGWRGWREGRRSDTTTQTWSHRLDPSGDTPGLTPLSGDPTNYWFIMKPKNTEQESFNSLHPFIVKLDYRIVTIPSVY